MEQITKGMKVRSFDFPGNTECFIEGAVIAADSETVTIMATREVFAGKCYCNSGKIVTAPQNGLPTTTGKVTQGIEVLERDGQHILDAITAFRTAFASFDDLLNAAGNYRPTIRCTRATNRSASKRELAELLQLADAYDQAQAARGDDRRAYRG